MAEPVQLHAPRDEEFEVSGRGAERRFWARGLSGLTYAGTFLRLVKLHFEAPVDPSGRLHLVLDHDTDGDRALTLRIPLAPGTPTSPSAPDGLDALIARLAAEPGLFAPQVRIDLRDALGPDPTCTVAEPGVLIADRPRPSLTGPLRRLARRFRPPVAV